MMMSPRGTNAMIEIPVGGSPPPATSHSSSCCCGERKPHQQQRKRLRSETSWKDSFSLSSSSSFSSSSGNNNNSSKRIKQQTPTNQTTTITTSPKTLYCYTPKLTSKFWFLDPPVPTNQDHHHQQVQLQQTIPSMASPPSPVQPPLTEASSRLHHPENSSSLQEPLLPGNNFGDIPSATTTTTPSLSSSGITTEQEQQQQQDADDDSKNIVIPLKYLTCGLSQCCCRCCCQQTESSLSAEEGQEPSEEETTTTTRRNHGDGVVDNDNGYVFRMNHNVFLNLIICGMYGISTSLANGTAYAAYVKHIGQNHNTPLGNIEAVEGLTSLLTALPIGYIADKIGRSIVIRFGGILLLICSILQIILMEWIGRQQYDENGTSSSSSTTTTALYMLGIIMACWGISDGVVNGPASALFADSTPEGQRSIYYTYLFSCWAIASCIGPLVSIMMFQTLGDNWDIYHLKLVIYVGLSIGMMNGILMLFFDDKKALEEDEEHTTTRSASPGSDETTTTATTTTTKTENAPTETSTIRTSSTATLDEQDTAEQGVTSSTTTITKTTVTTETITTLTNNVTILDDDHVLEQGHTPATVTTNGTVVVTEDQHRLQQRQTWIPYILFVSGLITSLGSGMTVKFFPLFFKDEVGMTPSQVQIVYVCVPLSMTICSYICSTVAGGTTTGGGRRGLGLGLGRVPTTLIVSFLGIGLLFSMVLFKSYLDNHPIVLVPIYILRTGLMNGTYPLVESILMDFVPKDERGRWKSLDSVAAFGWCGSAALGGWLADKYDYTYTFVITAILQTVGNLIFALLLPLVPRSEGTTRTETTVSRTTTTPTTTCCDNGGDSEATHHDPLREPLLQQVDDHQL